MITGQIKTQIDQIFFSHWYKSISNHIIANGHGATVKGVTLDFMRNLRMPVPPIEEQEKIVAELDEINELITIRKEQLNELDNLAQSLFYDIFGDPITNPKGWKISTFAEVFKKISAGGDKPVNYTKEKTQINIIPIFANGIENDGLYGYCKEAQVFEPALTISARGTIGFCSIKRNPFTPIIRLITAIPSELLILEYAKYYISNLNLPSTGNTIPQLPVPLLKKQKFILPPLSLQQQFAAQVEAIEAQKGVLNESLKELQTLLDSRMDYWFN